MSLQSKIDALQRLAAPDSGATPAEREVAQKKLDRALAKIHPRATVDSSWDGYRRLRSRYPFSLLGNSAIYKEMRGIMALYDDGAITKEDAKQRLQNIALRELKSARL